MPGTVVAEVWYLLARNAGARVESLFLQALAERLGVREVAALDRRHFTVVRPAHTPSLILLDV